MRLKLRQKPQLICQLYSDDTARLSNCHSPVYMFSKQPKSSAKDPSGSTGNSKKSVQRHLLLVTGIWPELGSGSGIVLLRHILRFLGDGWQVTVAAPSHLVSRFENEKVPWSILALPRRRAWWPPVRSSSFSLVYLRAALQARELQHLLASATPPTHVVTLLWDEWPLVARAFALRQGLPLTTIVHDLQEAWSTAPSETDNIKRRHRLMFSSSDRVLTVSNEILRVYDIGKSKGAVLYPIPGEKLYFDIESPVDGLKNHTIYFGGSLHPWQLENLAPIAAALSRRGGNLVLLTTEDNFVWRALSELYPQTKRLDPTEDNEAAVELVARNAGAFIVSYAIDQSKQPWAQTSFPSKLLDFARAGVPIAILAPPGTAIYEWCLRQDWPSISCDVTQTGIDRLLDLLFDEAKRSDLVSQIQRLALTEFSSKTIHRELEQAIVQGKN